MGKQLFFTFPVYAKALAAVIQNNSNAGSFVVGLTGPWGSGKTTLMEAVATELGEKEFLFVKFNAWAHSKQDSIWRALFVSIVAVLRTDLEKRFPAGDDSRSDERNKLETELKNAERSLYAAFTQETPGEMQLDAGQLAKSSVKLALRFIPWGDVGSGLADWFFNRSANKEIGSGAAGTLKEEDVEKLWGIFKRDIIKQHVAQIQSMEQFHNSIEAVLRSYLKDGRRLVVSVDDVDRCLPEQGLEVFEAIKLYLDLQGSVFLVAMDQDVLQHALDIRYKQTRSDRKITAELYAEKMIDLTFTIPLYDDEGFQQFILSLQTSGLLASNIDLIRSVLPANPRTWERFANRLSLYEKILKEIASDRKLKKEWQTIDLQKLLVKMQLLNFQWHPVIRALGTFKNLLALEKCVDQADVLSDGFQRNASSDSPREALRKASTSTTELPESIWDYLDDMSLLRFLQSPPRFSSTDQDTQLLASKMFSLDLPNEVLPVPSSPSAPTSDTFVP